MRWLRLGWQQHRLVWGRADSLRQVGHVLALVLEQLLALLLQLEVFLLGPGEHLLNIRSHPLQQKGHAFLIHRGIDIVQRLPVY